MVTGLMTSSLASFNPRSGHATGATVAAGDSRVPVVVSIRAPVTRPERLVHDGQEFAVALVSIRAPVTRPERQSKPNAEDASALFQSALRSRDRSDVQLVTTGTVFVVFQSALRSRDRSDIRAGSPRDIISRFQSALRSRDRSDSDAKFIRSVPYWFQSALRSRDRSDRLRRHRASGWCLFQSALRSRDRSDSSPSVQWHDADVSIRAPVTRPERRAEWVDGLQLSGFQSALRSRDRSDGLNGWTAYTYPGFNPRSGHATGATPQNSTDRPAVIVSIRAPVTRPERLKTDALNLTTALFQSALRSRDRSDSFSLSLVQR